VGRAARQRLRLNPRALLGAAVLALAACAPSTPSREQWLAFGSGAALQMPATTPEALRVDASRRLSAHWRARERDWHPWQPSALTAFNAALAAQSEAVAPPSLRPLIERSRPLVDDSGGLFDPGLGRWVTAWGFHTSDYPIRTPPPDEATLAVWAARPDSLRDLQCDDAWRCASAAPALRLDFNAVAEGLALEEGAALLRSLGVEHALMNLGGDVLALGDNDGAAWRVGLDDGEGGVLGGVALRDGEAFTSSGRYAKYREAPDGERWPHVLDPRSGRPATGARLSAVLHPDAVRADAAATALMVAGAEGFERTVHGMRLGCALLVDAEGRVWITRGMVARFAWQRDLPEAARIDMGDRCGAR
jgi:thiamine biosynthesis lipoprotein